MSASSKTLTSSLQAATEVRIRSRPRIMLAVMLLTVFMSVANIFIVNVATPSIQRSLHASFSGVQFVITSYTLAYAVALIIGGRLGDRFGRKRMLLLGVAGFTLASLLCGLAGGVAMLVAVRIVQGLSAAMMAPQVLSLIQVNYPPERRGAVFGMYGAAQGLAASTGQLIGGLLLRWNPFELDWRTVFFFSVPVGLLILSLIPFVRESKDASHAKLDWIGAIGALSGLLMLIYPLVQGQKEGWPPALIACLLLSFPVLAGFVWHEKRVARSGAVPFMNVDLFRQRVFTVGMLIVFLLLCSQAAYFLVSAYFLQIGLGFSALKAGLVILPMGMGYFAASLYSAKAVAKFGPHVLTFGAVLTAAGYFALAWSVHVTGVTAAGYEWIPALFALGFGQGTVAAPLTNTILAKIRSGDVGSASGILATGMQVAFAIGIALIGVVFLSALGRHADTVSGEIAPQLRQSLTAAQLPASEREIVVQQFRSCYGDYARATDPAALPASCSGGGASAQVKSLFSASMKRANSLNYAASFELCLYALGAFTAFLTPLVLVLLRGRRAPGQTSGSAR
ncbi:hypothetical protein SD70_09445 [Gordoniibacillus kamchatkensis]|uniref:Major facilitator superfamily (MFS) profile domain-containing protein n=1 Tax=Gordoniibacillus kamchatkensis TaxID=1590651 RepID=A0ABR5AJ41_9BACL|nr:MFS transporter [Paenibacillus sp. VKM B-2647]KIL41034.1 hypothetical protein SD70_09445 [Paenibacillus sp. VKM B-2647]